MNLGVILIVSYQDIRQVKLSILE